MQLDIVREIRRCIMSQSGQLTIANARKVAIAKHTVFMIVGQCPCLCEERLRKTTRERSIVDGLDVHVIVDLQK